MFFTKDIFESLVMIGVITAGIIWYGAILARREQRTRQESTKVA